MEIVRRHRKGNRKSEAVEYGDFVFIAGQIANDLSLDAVSVIKTFGTSEPAF